MNTTNNVDYQNRKELTAEEKEKVMDTFSSFEESQYDELDFKDVENGEDVLAKKSKSGPLKSYTEKISTLYSMLKDYFSKKYSLSTKTSSIVIGTLLYIIAPIDIIPDFLPFLGLVDDVAILGACLASISIELSKYQEWKENQNSL
ncbi:DUF1232 domain-containing protein [uncultured Treponema sp.]|uniref:YkvA family protein n=1 Tax=uncultured Treponema sp. TaxID=162155 RepID=UPI0025D45CCA|nr:DUF1232 domain-containing protein [uncultured Treponema sp.]